MQSPLVPQTGPGAAPVLDDPAGAPGHPQAGTAGSGWELQGRGITQTLQLALIFITFFAWGLFFGGFFSVMKIPRCCRGGVRRAVSLSRCPGSVKTHRAPGPSSPALGTAPRSRGSIPAGRSLEAQGTRSHVPSDPIHLLLPGTFCCSDQ